MQIKVYQNKKLRLIVCWIPANATKHKNTMIDFDFKSVNISFNMVGDPFSRGICNKNLQ